MCGGIGPPRVVAALERREVESEGVSIVEDDDHSAQDASFRGLKAKKTPSLVSRLAVGPSWNKVPR